MFKQGFLTTWQHPTKELGSEHNPILSQPVVTIVWATTFRVRGWQKYTQHAVTSTACMDRPAADMCTGRPGHAAKLACGFGPPACVGEACAHLPGDDTTQPSVLPKKGKHVPGISTVTWQRLLDHDKIASARPRPKACTLFYGLPGSQNSVGPGAFSLIMIHIR